MPKVLPEYLEQRRQQILDAAAACFARRGFHQSTMQHICEEAELSPGAVYRYFHSKEEIIEAMCARGQSQNGEAVDQALAQGSTLEIFSALIEIFWGEIESGLRTSEQCALNVELISEAPRNERVREYLTRSNEEVRTRFEDLIAAAQARSEIDPTLHPEAVARVMIALYHGYITQKLVEPDIDGWRYAEVLKSLFGGRFWCSQAPQSSSAESAALRH